MTSLQALSLSRSHLLRTKRIWALVWLLHTLMAAALAAFPAAFVAQSLAHSNWSQSLFREFDISWVFETLQAQKGMPFGAVAAAAAAISLLLLPLNSFLAGGAIAQYLTRDLPLTPRRFFENCGRYFWRFFRLFLISLLFYGLVLMLSASLNRLADKIWGKGMVAWPLVWAGRIRMLVVLVLFLLVHLVFDYAKIILVWEDRRSAWRSMTEAWRFILRNKARTLGLFALLLVLVLLIGLAWWGFRAATDSAPASLLVLVVVAQQCYVLARIGMRLLGWASQAELAKSLRPEYKPVVQPVFTPAPEPDFTI